MSLTHIYMYIYGKFQQAEMAIVYCVAMYETQLTQVTLIKQLSVCQHDGSI